MRLLLFSGGLDSTALAYMMRPDRLLFVDYGQIPAAGERRAALQIASELQIPIDERSLDCRSIGQGRLAGAEAPPNEPPEFWPLRNQFLITVAGMAYFDQAPLEILIGTVATDHVHRDGRKRFIQRARGLLEWQGELTLSAPAIDLSSLELLQQAVVPGSLLAWTFSCHVSEMACGVCRGCLKHYSTIRDMEESATLG